jgi:type VII secretion protein EccE
VTVRIMVALAVLAAAALAYPWQSTRDWWTLGIAAAAVTVVFAWWRGHFVTTMVGRAVAVWRRNHCAPTRAVAAGHQHTVAVRVAHAGPGDLPLPLIVGYLDRYGVRSRRIRITSDAGRATWISVTVCADDNLAALQARSARLPLRETTDIVARRLAAQLREIGWTASIVDNVEHVVPEVVKETWTGVQTDAGFVVTYRVAVDDGLPERVAALATPAGGWLALEFAGTPTSPAVAAACALPRGDDARLPAGLTPLNGQHRPALEAMNPLSGEGLVGVPAGAPAGVVQRLRWPSLQHEPAQEPGHPAQVVRLADV